MIYCVEDDSSIRDLMIYTLNMAGLPAQGFPESKSFWNAIKNNLPELVILDIMLPEEDGISILKKLRSSSNTKDIPIIMATAKDSEYDKVVALDLGADDYLSKPFGMMEMVSRIKAVLRRSQPKEKDSILKCDKITLNTIRHIVDINGQQISLTLKEFELLKLLMENQGRVFTRDDLLLTVWGTEFVGESRTIDVHIGTLRTKLGLEGNLIQTIRGVGYKMECTNE